MTSNPHDIKGVICLLGKVGGHSIDDRHQIYPKPGTGPQMLEWIGKLKAGVKNEPGTLEYSWAQNGDELLIWERYADAAAFETHIASDTFKAFIAADLMRKEPSMTFYSGEVKGGF